MNNKEIISRIVSAIHEAQQEKIVYKQLYHVKEGVREEHEFLFFIKPEITLASSDIKLEAILEMVFRQLEKFNLSVTDIRIIEAKYLEEYAIIAQHYGVINSVSRSASGSLTDSAREHFRTISGKGADEVTLLGSLEVLGQFPGFTPVSLDYLWQNCRTEKLAGGTYVAKTLFDGKEIYIINGFHPRQLEHYTHPGRSIVTMVLSGNTTWKDARNAFIGATNPGNAQPGSLRSQLLHHKQEFGLTTVSSSWNGFHLSAGPVEGLVELIRYTSDFSKKEIRKPIEFAFGKKLAQRFTAEVLEKIMNNALLDANGKKTSVFDLTEEKNSEEAMDVLEKYINT